MDLTIIILFVLSGLLTGLLAGLLGIGGGLITVPVIYYLLPLAGFPEEKIMQVAVGTSLAATFITSFASTWAHYHKKTIVFSAFKRIVPGLIFGCMFGALIAHFLPSLFLREIFGCMAILFGIYFLFPRFPHPRFGSSPNFTLSIFGLGIGTLSSLLGIGGGLFTVPVFLGYQLPMKNAVGTSSSATLVTALVGTISYLFIAWHKPSIPETFGYIELPVFFAISLGSVSTSWLGVKLSHVLHTDIVKRIFACACAITGILMLIS